ncbi:MAG TPA: hypothetical protein VGR45_05150 [Stellaceae bacterium]|nr:hypothetical protein [Stellaceae bacterium]
MNQLIPNTSPSSLPALITDACGRASMRLLEFFAGNIRSLQTPRAYARLARRNF